MNRKLDPLFWTRKSFATLFHAALKICTATMAWSALQATGFSAAANAGYASSLTGSEASGNAERQFLSGSLGFKDLILVQRKELNPSHVYTYHAEGLSAGGGLFRYSLLDKTLTRLVDATGGVILDAQVSYDGRQILFSWKRTMSQPFQIHRIDADGGGLAQISWEPCNNMNPCWLPDGGIAFLSDRKPAFAYCWITTSPVLYRSMKGLWMSRSWRRRMAAWAITAPNRWRRARVPWRTVPSSPCPSRGSHGPRWCCTMSITGSSRR